MLAAPHVELILQLAVSLRSVKVTFHPWQFSELQLLVANIFQHILRKIFHHKISYNHQNVSA